MAANVFIFKAASDVSPNWSTFAGAEGDVDAGGTVTFQDSGVYLEICRPTKAMTITNDAGTTPTIGKVSGGGQDALVLTDSGLSGGITLTVEGANSSSHIIFLAGTGSGARVIEAGGVEANLAVELRRCTFKCPNSNIAHMNWSFNDDSATLLMEKCRIEATGGQNSLRGLNTQRVGSTDGVVIRNCEFVGFNGTGNVAVDIDRDSATGNSAVKVINCSFHDCTIGLRTNQAMTSTNNAFGSCTDDVSISDEGGNGDFSFCVFGEQTDTGGFGSGNQFATDPGYNSAPTDLTPGGGSAMIDNGTDTSGDGVTDDFNGISRPQNSVYDVGAHELVVGGVVSQTQIMSVT